MNQEIRPTNYGMFTVHFDILSPCARWLAQDIDEVFVIRVSFILNLSLPYDFPFIAS